MGNNPKDNYKRMFNDLAFLLYLNFIPTSFYLTLRNLDKDGRLEDILEKFSMNDNIGKSMAYCAIVIGEATRGLLYYFLVQKLLR